MYKSIPILLFAHLHRIRTETILSDTMKLLIVSACLTLVAVHGYSVRQLQAELDNAPVQDADSYGSDEISDTGSEVEEEIDAAPKRNCWCMSPYGCYCSAKTSTFKVTVVISLDELSKCGKRMVVAAFHINKNVNFDVLFPLNQIENFCHMTNGVMYCFDLNVNIQYKRCTDELHGCISLTRPHHIAIGCFKLPKITVAGCPGSELEEGREMDTESESEEGRAMGVESELMEEQETGTDDDDCMEMSVIDRRADEEYGPSML